MIISTRGRYALKVMVDLAEHGNGEHVPLKEVVERLGLSQKYLESIMMTLSKGDFVEGSRGKGGGYRLMREPEDYKIWDILKLTDGSLSSVSCPAAEGLPCDRSDVCRTLPVWKKLDDIIEEYLSGITIADLMRDGGISSMEETK